MARGVSPERGDEVQIASGLRLEPAMSPDTHTPRISGLDTQPVPAPWSARSLEPCTADPLDLAEGAEKLVPVYVAYIERIVKHYEIGLRQFQIYFGFNAGLFALLAFVLKPYIEQPILLRSPQAVLAVIVMTSVPCLLGVFFSIAWRGVMIDSRRWQLEFNAVIGTLERSVFRSSSSAFYTRINANYHPRTQAGSDLIDLNAQMPTLFLGIWFALPFVLIGLYWLANAGAIK